MSKRGSSYSSYGSSGNNKVFEIIWKSDPVKSPDYLSEFQKSEFERFHTKFYDAVAVSKIINPKTTVSYGLDDFVEDDPDSLFSLINYRVGDFVYCAQADDNNRNYFTAQIRAFYQREGGSKSTKYMCHLQWLYRPSDLAPGLYDAHPKELLGGYWIDANPVTLLRGHFNLLFGFSVTSKLVSKVQAAHHYFIKSMFYETKGHTPYTETLPRDGKVQGQIASNVIPVGGLAEIYNLQSIIKRRQTKSGEWEYLVQWEDWSEQSWVPESELDSTAIANFLKESKKKSKESPHGTPKKKTPSTPSRRSSRIVSETPATPKKTPKTPKKQKKKSDKKTSKKSKKAKDDEDSSWSEAEYEDAEDEEISASDGDVSAEEEAEVKQQAKKRRLSETKSASSKEPKPKVRKTSKKSKSKGKKSKGAPDGEHESDSDDANYSDALTHPASGSESESESEPDNEPLFQSSSSSPLEASGETVVENTQSVTSQVEDGSQVTQCSVAPTLVESQNNEDESDRKIAQQVEDGTQTQEDDSDDANKSCCVS